MRADDLEEFPYIVHEGVRTWWRVQPNVHVVEGRGPSGTNYVCHTHRTHTCKCVRMVEKKTGVLDYRNATPPF